MIHKKCGSTIATHPDIIPAPISIMANLSCKYLGLDLRNPLIVGSSGLTSKIDNLHKIEEAGAGALILKSVFEEQIHYETDHLLQSDEGSVSSWNQTFQSIVSQKEYYYDEAYEYLSGYAKEHSLKEYLDLVSRARKELSIPVIASINCNTSNNWEYFARRLQDSGAHALELNVFILPSDPNKSVEQIEKIYFQIIDEVKKQISIPLSIKIGYYFSSLSRMAIALSRTGIQGLTLFTRPFSPDFDIDTLEISTSNMLSAEAEYTHTLRWIALLAGKVGCDLSASSGNHDYQAVVKQLLAGADSVQMVSAFYKHHFSIIPQILSGVSEWMDKHNFATIADFKGKMSHARIENPAAFERVQFMRLYSSHE